MSVTSVSSANADISVVNGTTTPVLTLNSGAGANQIVKRDANGNINVYILKSTLNADITTAVQSAVNTYTEVIIDGSPGQYVINATISLPIGVTLRGINDATIICGASPSAPLSNQMWYIHVTNNNCIIANLTFLPPSGGFGTLNFGSAAIYVSGANNMIQECTFSFSFGYGLGVFAVWCDGSAANYNKILNNYCNTVGITYAEHSASYNICDGNYILNASQDGLAGTGDGPPTIPPACTGNIVSNNVVIGAGYNGIEDQQYIDGTIISHNVIINTGLARASGNGMAISAVGTNTQIIGNIISGGYYNYAIEAFGAGGLQIEDNQITELTGQQYGIFINHYNSPVPQVPTLPYTPPTPPPPTTVAGRLNATNVINNNITGCSTCIKSEGDNNVYLNIDGNKIKDFFNNGIVIQTNCLDASVNIDNNTIVLTQPNILVAYYERVGIGTGTSASTIGWFIRISNNNIIYESTAGGGNGDECGIIPGHAGTLIENNVVNSNGIQAGVASNVYTYWTNYTGGTDSVKYVNNKSFGTYATVDLSLFTNTIQTGNNWTMGDTQVLFDIIETATDASYTVTRAGVLVKLPVITGTPRVVTLPSANQFAGATIKIWNQNTSGTFVWSFASSKVKNAANSFIGNLTNQVWYILVSDGLYWNKTN